MILSTWVSRVLGMRLPRWPAGISPGSWAITNVFFFVLAAPHVFFLFLLAFFVIFEFFILIIQIWFIHLFVIRMRKVSRHLQTGNELAVVWSVVLAGDERLQSAMLLVEVLGALDILDDTFGVGVDDLGQRALSFFRVLSKCLNLEWKWKRLNLHCWSTALRPQLNQSSAFATASSWLLLAWRLSSRCSTLSVWWWLFSWRSCAIGLLTATWLSLVASWPF